MSSTQQPTPTKRYQIKTFGCKANLQDSQQIEGDFVQDGWQLSSVHGDTEVCVVNTCSVTDEADKQARKYIRWMAKKNPNAKIVVTGCAAEVDPKQFQDMPEVAGVIGNRDKHQLKNWIDQGSELKNGDPKGAHILKQQSKVTKSQKVLSHLTSKHPFDKEWPAARETFRLPELQSVQSKDASEKTTRAFLKIQEGCNEFCTYCIIPYGRGPSRSLEPEALIEQVTQLQSQGVREIVITGTNIGGYGEVRRSSQPLVALISGILKETSIERIRISSLDPTEITEDLLTLYQDNSRLCPHFHVSLQSPHSRILRLMKRPYRFEDVQECLLRIEALGKSLGLEKQGGVFVGMDVITGFPGETEEEFEWGFERLSELSWSRLHVFPYSERHGTPATRLPNSVENSIRVKRAQTLRKLSLDRQLESTKKVLQYLLDEKLNIPGVLFEHDGKDWVSGYSSNYLRTMVKKTPTFDAQASLQNQIRSVKPLDLVVDSAHCDVSILGTLS